MARRYGAVPLDARLVSGDGGLAVDLLKLFRSIEELLFELAAWCIFYPRTLWRVVTTPVAMAQYSDEQQGAGAATRAEHAEPLEPYSREMSPPALLLISILLFHLIELGLHVKLPEAHNELSRPLLAPGLNLLVVRASFYSFLALVLGASILFHEKAELDRKKLRPLFFGQCYLVSPFAICASAWGVFSRLWAPFPWVGLACFVVGTGWLLWAEAGYLERRLGLTAKQAYVAAAWWIARGIVALGLVVLGVAMLF